MREIVGSRFKRPPRHRIAKCKAGHEVMRLHEKRNTVERLDAAIVYANTRRDDPTMHVQPKSL